MRVTILRNHGTVGIDGIFTEGLDLSELPANIHAIQWKNTVGEIEFTDKANQKLNDFAPYQLYVALAQDTESARAQAIVDAEQAAIEALTLDEVKRIKINEINMEAETALNVITQDYPESERLSWDKQESEARAYLVDSNSLTPLLSAIVTGRGETVLNIANRVVTKADIFVVLAGSVFGQRQAFEEQTNDTTTKAEVKAIVINYTIPVV